MPVRLAGTECTVRAVFCCHARMVWLSTQLDVVWSRRLSLSQRGQAERPSGVAQRSCPPRGNILFWRCIPSSDMPECRQLAPAGVPAGPQAVIERGQDAGQQPGWQSGHRSMPANDVWSAEQQVNTLVGAGTLPPRWCCRCWTRSCPGTRLRCRPVSRLASRSPRLTAARSRPTI